MRRRPRPRRCDGATIHVCLEPVGAPTRHKFLNSLVMTDFIDTTLTDMAFNGPALSRVNGQVVFADFGIPGETVRVAVEGRKKDYLSGRVVETFSASP